MDKLELKRKVLEKVKETQDALIKELAFSRDCSRMSSDAEDNEEGFGNVLNGAKATIMGDVDRLSKQLSLAGEQRLVLDRLIASEEHEQVMLGSVVKTNVNNFFIAVSLIDKVNVDGTEFIGISMEAPICSVLLGKKPGDKFEFNTLQYEILDVF